MHRTKIGQGKGLPFAERAALHLNLESHEDFKSKGYFLVDAIKCRLDKKDKIKCSYSGFRKVQPKFLSRELRGLKPKTIVVLGNSAKKASQRLSETPNFSDFKKLRKHKVTNAFEKILCDYRMSFSFIPEAKRESMNR